MDPPVLVNEASFTAAANPSSYSLAGILPFPRGMGVRMRSSGGEIGAGGDCSVEESTVTERSRGNGEGKRGRGSTS
ncbi:hypothetical protein M569_00591, partial [Genlisea aurea]